jgi:hypothetical protein
MAKVTIDGKEYDTDTLSDEAKNHIQNVQYCEKRMAELQRELAVAQTARNAYAQALKGALPKDA